MDQEEEEKLDECHGKDKEDEKKYQKFLDKSGEDTFWKLVPYNKPAYWIIVALIAAFVDGLGQPLFGIVFSKILNLLLVPITVDNKEEIIEKSEMYCLLIFLVGVLMFISMTVANYAWGILGENVTITIR